MSKEPKNLEQRDGFQSKWGFILACIGSAVGMGNIWRFPIMVQKYGGMTFLLPYFIFVILIGSTGVIEEFALGRRAAAGPVGAFGMCTKERTGSEKSGKAIGAIPIIGALMLAIGYTVVLGWIFKYTFMSLSGSLFSLGTDMGAIGGTFGMTAPEAETLPEALKAMASAGFFGIVSNTATLRAEDGISSLLDGRNRRLQNRCLQRTGRRTPDRMQIPTGRA